MCTFVMLFYIFRKSSRRLVYYSLIGWGLPFLFALVAIGIDVSPLTSYEIFKPNFGISSCWFHGKINPIHCFFEVLFSQKLAIHKFSLKIQVLVPLLPTFMVRLGVYF